MPADDSAELSAAARALAALGSDTGDYLSLCAQAGVRLGTTEALNRLQDRAPVPAWAAIALGDLSAGVAEVSGRAAHPRIVQALAETHHPSRSDETAWCSAIMCLWMAESGLQDTNSAAARSWLKWGVKCEPWRQWAVCVLWRVSPASRSGHVGLLAGWDDKHVRLLGGNQGNQVSIKAYPRSRVLGVRWPDGLG